VDAAVARVRELEKDLERFRGANVLSAAGELARGGWHDEFGVAVVTHRAPDETSVDDLRKLALDVRGRMPTDRPTVVAAAAVHEGRPVIVIAVNEVAQQWGLAAGQLVREAAGVLGGGGGGRDDVAQGGGSNAEATEEALTAVRHAVGRRVTHSE
jgi:alanyl-tRNA synthetase